MKVASLGLVPLGLVAVFGCRRAPSPEDCSGKTASGLCFVDVAERCGIRFFQVCGGKEKDYIIETNGGGCALLDYDGDGDLDVFLVNGARLEPPWSSPTPVGPPGTPSDALFRNDGPWRFTDVTDQAGLRESAWGCGCAAADYDNDGDPDIFVTNYGPDTLWRNNGDGTFTDVTATAGTNDPGWGSSCAWLDYDRDGFLDLFVVNYLEFDVRKVPRRGSPGGCTYKGQQILCGPQGLPPAPRTLYRNRGDGTFEDVTAKTGISSAPPSYGLGVIVFDYDRNDWPDIFVTNDTRPNMLFANRGGTFEEVAITAGCGLNEMGVAQAGMGIAITFRSGSGYEDIFMCAYEDDTNTYYRNSGQGYFTEVTSVLGLGAPCFKNLSWSCLFFDPDLDGREDVFIACGHVVPQADQIPSSAGYRQPKRLFLDKGSGKFIDASEEAGPGLKVRRCSRGAAVGDLDGDGDPDIVVNEIDDPATVLENRGPAKGHWLAVRTVGTVSNRDGIGAVVSVKVGDSVQMRRIRSGCAFASSSEIVARFGLGEATRVDELRVRWPTGKEETYAVPGVDRVVRVVEGEGASG